MTKISRGTISVETDLDISGIQNLKNRKHIFGIFLLSSLLERSNFHLK